MNVGNLFKGRIRRGYFVWGGIFYAIVFGVLQYLIAQLPEGIGSPILMIVILINLALSLGLNLRRIHDIGKSGWWLLLLLVPVVNFFFILWLVFKSSEPKTNAYGPVPNPKSFFEALFNQ